MYIIGQVISRFVYDIWLGDVDMDWHLIRDTSV